MDNSNALRRKTLAQEFRNLGTEKMPDERKLELLLSFTVRKDMDKMAAQLLNTFGSFNAIFEADKYALLDAKLSENSVSLILMARDFYSRTLEDNIRKITNITQLDAIKDFAKIRLSHLKQETILTLYYDKQRTLLKMEYLAGTLDHAIIYPREIASTAKKLRAKLIILAHNHPSGCSKPSANDILVTNQIIKAVEFLDIYVADHIIVSANSTFSMSENGIL